MGRIYLGKPAKDTEAASESILHTTLTNSFFEKMNGSGAQTSVTAQLHTNNQIDDLYEKKRK